MASALIKRLRYISIPHIRVGQDVLKPIGYDPNPSEKNGSSLSKTFPTPTSSSEPSFTIWMDLPVELWLEILEFIIDRTTLMTLMRVSRAFYDEAEARLYRTVSLEFERTIYQFCESITASPHRAKLVTGFHLTTDETLHAGSISRVLLPVLQSFRNLEYLTFNVYGGWGHNKTIKAVLAMRFPFLRGFVTNGSLAAHPLSLSFLQEHPFLEELEFGASHSQVSDAWLTGVSSIRLPSLKAIACRSWFLHDAFPVPSTLTHLHATSLKPGELGRLVKLLGKRLASLRISQYVRSPPHLDALALDEIARDFPRLRFLQIDMDHKVKPYINKHPIDCTAARSRTRTGTGTATPISSPHRGFTLALVYAQPQVQAVDMKVAAAWHEFLNKTALQVLREWGDDCVERVVYRHTIIPFVSVSLSADGMRLVRRQDTEMRDDWWKRV